MDSPKTPDYWQWQFLQTMNEALCSFRARVRASAGSARCIGLVLPEQKNQFQWGDLEDEEQVRPIVHGHKYGDVYSAIIIYQQVSLSINTVEYFLPLYASLFCFDPDQVIFYATHAVKLMCFSRLMVMCLADNYKARIDQNLEASTCPTPVFDPLNDTMSREISLKTSVEVLRC